MTRPAGMSVRLRLALSYTGFLAVAGALLLAAVWFFLLRYVPTGDLTGQGGFAPNRDDLIRAFAPVAALVLAGLLVIGLVGGWLLAGRMLAPLTRLTRATRAVADGSLSHRIRLPGRDDEFRELADAFDAMLDRIETQVSQQQRFAANASHELRTPLATMQTMLEVAMSTPGSATDVLLRRLAAVNARAIDLTEALLLLSRAGQRSFPREPVDLALAAEDATETLLPLAEREGVSIILVGHPAVASGSTSLLLQLTMNLVQNAIVHNRHGGTVQVSTSAGAKDVELVVENAGERVPPDLVGTLTEPFQRGSGRIRGDRGGVGLGLAIVASIVEVHDGRLEIEARPEGGLRVRVVLPTGDAGS